MRSLRSCLTRRWPMLLPVMIAATTLAHFTFGRWFIRLAYEKSLPWKPLNNVIEGQARHAVDHYYRAADSWLLAVLAALVILFHLIRYFEARAVPHGTGLPYSLLAAIVTLAWSNRFIQDDAFISFRYAANLAAGHGLTWNPGEAPIEGYTNPLWTVLMSIPLRFGFDPVLPSQILGLACLTANLFVSYRVALLMLQNAKDAMLAIIFLGTNYTFSAYATGGLETQLQSFLLTTSFYAMIQICEAGRFSYAALVGFSVLLALSVINRLDAILPSTVLLISLVASIVRSSSSAKVIVSQVAALLGPGLLTGMLYGAWKLSYYGNLLPNTFYVKTSGERDWLVSAGYFWVFTRSYGWLPFLPLLAISVRRVAGRIPFAAVAQAIVGLWLVYIFYVGGDFMEFRFLVPILPLVFILFQGALHATCSKNAVGALTIGLVLMSAVHARTFQGAFGVEDISSLNAHVVDQHWKEIGQSLAQLFPEQRDITIATSAAGAIPFYSGLRTIDMLGLNDAWIARYGTYFPERRSGHRRHATLKYLLDRQTNLVIGHPRVNEHGDRHHAVRSTSDFIYLPDAVTPSSAQIVELALAGGRTYFALYLIRHPEIDRVIRERNLRFFPVNP